MEEVIGPGHVAPGRVPKPRSQVIYEGKDITAHIEPLLIELSYSDCIEGESDTVELLLLAADRRWQNGWYPGHGDVLEVHLGYEGEPPLACGVFEIDEVELEGAPDVFRIKALGAGITRRVRTNFARAFDDKTLADIAREIAARNQLTLTGEIENIRIGRSTQTFETDLAFLKRLAASYGYAFSVRGAKLTFFKRAELKAASSVLVIEREHLTRFRFRDKIRAIVTSATVACHEPASRAVKTSTVQDPNARGNVHSADELKLNNRVENESQARLQAIAAIDRANEDQTCAEFSLPGDVRLVAGVNVTVHGFGKFDGKYTIHRSRHYLSRGTGYGTDLELKRVRDAQQGAEQ